MINKKFIEQLKKDYRNQESERRQIISLSNDVLFHSKKGIPFDSFDFIPSKIFFVILSPKHPKKTAISKLVIIANICRTMKIDTIRTQIVLANNLHDWAE